MDEQAKMKLVKEIIGNKGKYKKYKKRFTIEHMFDIMEPEEKSCFFALLIFQKGG